MKAPRPTSDGRTSDASKGAIAKQRVRSWRAVYMKHVDDVMTVLRDNPKAAIDFPHNAPEPMAALGRALRREGLDSQRRFRTYMEAIQILADRTAASRDKRTAAPEAAPPQRRETRPASAPAGTPVTRPPHPSPAPPSIPATSEVRDLIEAFEGTPRVVTHVLRERRPAMVLAFKQRLESQGKLSCVVCRFDFAKTYGDLGKGFIEAHHYVPLARAGQGRKVTSGILRPVCSNCHRMLHRLEEKEMRPAKLREHMKEARASQAYAKRTNGASRK